MLVMQMLTKDDVIEILKGIKDPELNIDIWTLGLIYEIVVKGDAVDIKMTFTSPTCPYGPQIVDAVKVCLEKKGFKEQNIEVVFDPVWKPSDDLRDMLGI